ncbi:MAG: pyrroline-5-carboxylate reductase, partial [Candidatus Marivariicella framensis]
MKIAIIGTGNLGLSIAKGLIINDIITKLYLTKRNCEDLKKWNENQNITVTNDNREAVSNSDILIFAVQPSQFENILKEVVDLLNEKHVIISTITGFKINRIESIVSTNYPIIRSMPNTAISVGKSMTCLC